MRAIIIVLVCLAAPLAAAEQWSMGFWYGPDGVPTSSFDGLWGGLTHMIVLGVEPDDSGDGALHYADGQAATHFADMVAAGHAHGVRVMLNLSTGGNGGASWATATTSALPTFVANIAGAIQRYGFDGVDLDWEGNFGTTYYPNMHDLLVGLRQALGTKLITVDVGLADAFWVQNAPLIDRLDIMTYDEAGNWNPYSWFNSALYSDPNDWEWSLDLSKRRSLASGFPADKLCLGLAFYGYKSTGGGVTGPRQSNAGTPSLNQLNYKTIAANYDITNPQWDAVAHVPWIETPDGWITFDNERSLTDKVHYIQQNGLGGWIIWNNDSDYLPARSPSHPLLAAVQSAMGSVATAPRIGSFTATPATIAAGSSTTLAWSTTGATSVTIGGVGAVAASGSLAVSPTATSTYTLSAGGGGTMVAASTTVTVTTTTAPVISGHVYSLLAKHSGKALDVAGGPSATANGANVQQWSWWGGTNQRWRVAREADGSYTLTALHSGKVLDVANASTLPGGNVIQWSDHAGANQRWRIADLGSGWCVVANVGSGLVLDVQGGVAATQDGANVEQWSDAGADNERWRFIDVGLATPFGGSPRAIPGRIEAEDFDDGGEGVAYHDDDPTNDGGAYRATGVDIRASRDVGGGVQVGWFHAGEWLQYTTRAATAGTYAAAVHVANGDVGGTCHLEIDGVDVTGALSTGATGGWDSFTTLTHGDIAIGAGVHAVRLVCDRGAVDVNWLSFSGAGMTATVARAEGADPAPTPTAAASGKGSNGGCGRGAGVIAVGLALCLTGRQRRERGERGRR